MTQWTNFLSMVETGVSKAALEAFHGFVDESKADARAFLTAAKADLDIWTDQLATGAIDARDFTDFVKADAALAVMTALTQAGIAAADAQHFRDKVIDIVIEAAVTVFVP